MEIKGIKKLKSNSYNKIRIVNDKVTITGTNENTIEGPSTFDNAKKLSKEELTNLICSYYSNYHRINYINEKLSYKETSLGEVRSIDGTILTFERPLYKESANLLFNNYTFNRKDFVLNNITPDINIYVLNGETSYRKTNDTSYFTLNIDDNHKLSLFELEFLEFLLNTIFTNEIVNIEYKETLFWENINLESLNHKIDFCTLFLHDDRVKDIIDNFIREHNKEVENNKVKVLQMKMED